VHTLFGSFDACLVSALGFQAQTPDQYTRRHGLNDAIQAESDQGMLSATAPDHRAITASAML
jgi:hypothetical protein